MKIQLELEDQEVANLYTLVSSFREKVGPENPSNETLRDLELKLSGALRSHGWKPKLGGGWEQHGRVPGKRF